MSKSGSKKKVVVTTTSKGKVAPTVARSQSRRTASSSAGQPGPLVFGKLNYIMMAAGIGLIMLGLFLMSGGAMEDPNVWNADEIYSTRRTVLAPLVIILGIVVQIVAIFKKEKPALDTDSGLES